MKAYHFSEAFSPFSDIITKYRYQDLNDHQREIIYETLAQQIQLYFQHRTIYSAEGVSGLIEYIVDTHKVATKSVGLGSLEITFGCTSLESLESLWNDYQSGHLNDIAERYLVTDDIKRKLMLENVRMKTTIDEENYRICKMILMEKSCELQDLSKELTALELKGKIRVLNELITTIQFAYCGPKLKVFSGPCFFKNLIKLLTVSYGSDTCT